MASQKETLVKRYYTISEVASMFGVSASLIRFWETEFEVLKPHKNARGDRRFTPENIEQIRKVYHLVKERGFTLQGAKQELRHLHDSSKKRTEVLESLRTLRKNLEALKEQL